VATRTVITIFHNNYYHLYGSIKNSAFCINPICCNIGWWWYLTSIPDTVLVIVLTHLYMCQLFPRIILADHIIISCDSVKTILPHHPQWPCIITHSLQSSRFISRTSHQMITCWHDNEHVSIEGKQQKSKPGKQGQGQPCTTTTTSLSKHSVLEYTTTIQL